MRALHTHSLALLLASVLATRTGSAQNQTRSASAPLALAIPSGVFFRAGLTVGSFDLQRLSFRPSQGPRATVVPGKEFLQNGALSGASFGLQIDSRWFYIRVAADLYQNPNVLRPGVDSARFTTATSLSFGPRVVLGPVALLAGVRLGALLMNVNTTDRSTGARQDYDAIEGLYAADLGAQWRPLRYFELDAVVSQDFGILAGTTFSLSANFGWSRSAR